MSAGTDRRDAYDRALEARGIDPSGNMSRYQLKEMIRVAEIMGVRVSYDGSGSDTAAVAATYDTDPDQGADAAIVYTATANGNYGVDPIFSIQYADTAADGHSDVSLYWAAGAGTFSVVIGIKTGVTLASEVMALLALAHVDEWITYAYKAGNDGTGVVVTMAAKPLAGGSLVVPGDAANFVITPAAS